MHTDTLLPVCIPKDSLPWFSDPSRVPRVAGRVVRAQLPGHPDCLTWTTGCRGTADTQSPEKMGSNSPPPSLPAVFTTDS